MSEFKGHENQGPKTIEAINNPDCGWFFNAKPDDFRKIPGSPIVYSISSKIVQLFSNNSNLDTKIALREGIHTGNNESFLRSWAEVNYSLLDSNSADIDEFDQSKKKWVPYNKGGSFRKWYGNNDLVIRFDPYSRNEMSQLKGHVRPSQKLYFKPGGTWSALSSGNFGLRFYPQGFLFDSKGQVAVGDDYRYIVTAMNSSVMTLLAKVIMPTLDFKCGDVKKLPYLEIDKSAVVKLGLTLEKISKNDWDSYETSWDFTQNPIIRTGQPILEQAFNTWQQQNADAVAEMKRLEEENNKLFIEAYGLQDELTPEVPDAQITLTRANREKDSQRLVSYALGCMMGRYSLDESGLIYAHAGNQDFDASRYQTFPADADGIIPLTEMHWFEDDATHRIQEFLTAVWGKDTLDANMLWLAESLGKKANETSEDTIRRYLASKFYKDHMQTYKKRPIYWLFSSGKQGAFQALVYLHRYNESTLARMRTEYVMPLISKMAAMVNSLQSEIENSDSAAEIKRKEKELQNLHKQQAELSSFEEKLRHYADQRITLDLDDGVKVNYGKFGDLLAEVKAITGEK